MASPSLIHLPVNDRPASLRRVASRTRGPALRVAAALAVVLCASPLVSQVAAKGPFRFSKLGLTIDLSELPGFERKVVDHTQIVARFEGTLGKVDVQITLWKFPRKAFRFSEPDALARHIARNLQPGDPTFEFTSQEFVEGKYGYVPYAVLASAPLVGESDTVVENYFLFGILEDHCYQVQAETSCTLGAAERKTMEAFLRKGVTYDGEERDWEWSLAEAKRRWNEHTPAKLHKQLKVRRTKHYIILYNAGGALFAKKMEEFYKKIQKTFPFPEVKGRRLMPVFLFRIDEQYHHYDRSVSGRTGGAGGRSKGHAWRDYYATYYDSPNDPVHIHEATHQIFANRLHLSGGGSWFQEGVAEYMSEQKNTIRASVRNRIKSGEYVRFKTLMVVPSLLGSIGGSSVRGGSNARAAYLQSGSIITFLRESKFGKKRFLDFVHAVGAVRRGDLKAIEAALQEIYQIDIAGLEARWKKHWGR